MKVSDTMPAVIDGVVIENCNGSINLGDKYNVHPIEQTKAYNGSGSSNVGFSVRAFNGISATDVYDKDVNDQGIQFTL
ncbi:MULTISPECIES: spore germination protein [Bacillus]|nr:MULTISPECIES: spore germination protein [Bacillus cereus group]MDF2083137.1 spore germination protein [Bacillus pseudomycoides]PEK71878.1 spore germination protein [Bacillus pseudomycoides]PEL31926.1 spore germination protein [Bacillus pseudomycoides]PGE79802.1 spore germination protein [Bacillus pseudomycoides]